MSGKRGFSIIEQIKLMSVRGKVTIVILLALVIATVFTCTYMSVAKENGGEVKNLSTQQVVELEAKEDLASTEEIVVNEPMIIAASAEEEKDKEKEVEFKGKKVTVPKAKVASANSAEDSQKKKKGGESISAQDAVNKFENDGQSAGIDVSAHQGRIDWAQVKASGIEFAMIRCGFRGYTAGSIYEDAYFKSNIRGAINNGIKVGIYFYSVAINEEEALQEAAWTVEAIKSYGITYPVVYDFEDFHRGRTNGISRAQATSNALTFLNYIASKGYQPMMYANKNDITNNFDRGRLGGYKFWLAHYTSATNYTGSYQMWQYTSSGSVPGISGRVDMNVAYFRYGAVAEPKHRHDFEHGSVIKTSESKEPTCTENGVKFIRCKECSENQRQEIPALGHKFGKYEIVKVPTEDEEGLKVRECSACHEKEELKIDKLEPGQNNTNGNVGNTTTNTQTNTNTNTNTNTTPPIIPPKDDEGEDKKPITPEDPDKQQSPEKPEDSSNPSATEGTNTSENQ